MKKYPHVQPVRAGGRTYHYFRRAGAQRQRLPGEPGSPEFDRAYSRALAKSVKPENRPPTRAKRGTVAWWAEEYRNTPEWERLSARTKEIYNGFLGHLIALYGERPLGELTEARVWRVRDTAPGPVSRVNGMLKVLSNMCALAVRRGKLPTNPCANVSPRPTSGEGHAPWTELLVDRYQAHWARGTLQRAAFDLGLYTAQRRGDVCRMRWDAIEDGGVNLTQGKTGRALFVPLHADLIETLAETPRLGPFIVGTQAGSQRSDKAFGNWFRESASAAGVPAGYPFHGLRKTAAVRLVEAGVSVDDACAITGHSDPKMLRHYAATADQRVRAKRAMERLQSQLEQSAKL